MLAGIAALSLGAACQRPDSEPRRTLPSTNKPGVTELTAPTVQPKSPDVAPKPAASEIKLSKKPEELFRALLTTPFTQSSLTRGLTPKGNSAGNLDATAQALGAVGQVNILFSAFGAESMPNGGISYTIFPDASMAKGGYDVLATHSSISNRRALDSNYPMMVLNQSTFGSPTTVCAISFENVLVVATQTGVNPQAAQEEIAIMLTYEGVEHLVRVGR